jgi:phosphatidylglycerol---prolipoprotein diacylglyceryl transferase
VFPVLLKYGPITIYSFGVLMAAGFYFGSLVSVKEYERRGGNGDTLWNMLVWVFLAGLFASRVLSIFNNPQAFYEAPVAEILAGSGFVWYGGFLGGALAAWILGRRHGVDFLTLADCCAPGLLLGQAFGRIGCHVAGDGDWGSVTTLPWGVAYTNGIVPWDHPPGVLVHPTPLYEAAAYTAVFWLLWRWRKSDPPKGAMFAAYLVGNGFFRLLVEFLRIEPRFWFGLSQAQYIGGAMTVVGLVWLWMVRGNEPAPRISGPAAAVPLPDGEPKGAGA